MSVCYGTSPSWWVQRLSHGDWPSPRLIFAGWNAKGAPVYKCVLCGCTRSAVPIDDNHVPCCKGRARLFFSFFKKKVWLKLDSVCCHSQHSRLHCKRQGNVTTPSWWGIYFILLFFLFFGGEEAFRDLTWNPLIAHLVYLSKLQFIWSAQQLAGRACVTFSWKIHFTSRRQKFPVRATFTF